MASASRKKAHGVVLLLGVLLFGYLIAQHAQAADGTLLGQAARGSTAVNLPSCLKAWENAPWFEKYKAYFAAHQNVLRAWNPCRDVPEIFQWTMVKLEEAERTGEIPTAPLPQDYLLDPSQTSISATVEESNEIIGAKKAATLYIEVNEKTQWRIWTYPQSALVDLFNVCNAGYVCNGPVAWFGAQFVLDHSPREAWNALAAAGIDVGSLATPQELLERINMVSREFIHGGFTIGQDGQIISQTNTGAATLQTMLAERISRNGCHSMSAFQVQLAAAVNIPGDQQWEFYGRGHASAIFPNVNLVLAHGDDPYNAYYDDTPALEIYDSYARWLQDVLRGKITTATYIEAARHGFDKAYQYPSAYITYNYCNYGRTNSGRSFASAMDYLRYAFTYLNYQYYTDAQLIELAARIDALTSGCAVIPPDNPDG